MLRIGTRKDRLNKKTANATKQQCCANPVRVYGSKTLVLILALTVLVPCLAVCLQNGRSSNMLTACANKQSQ